MTIYVSLSEYLLTRRFKDHILSSPSIRLALINFAYSSKCRVKIKIKIQWKINKEVALSEINYSWQWKREPVKACLLHTTCRSRLRFWRMKTSTDATSLLICRWWNLHLFFAIARGRKTFMNVHVKNFIFRTLSYYPLILVHQREKIAREIAAKIAFVIICKILVVNFGEDVGKLFKHNLNLRENVHLNTWIRNPAYGGILLLKTISRLCNDSYDYKDPWSMYSNLLLI